MSYKNSTKEPSPCVVFLKLMLQQHKLLYQMGVELLAGAFFEFFQVLFTLPGRLVRAAVAHHFEGVGDGGAARRALTLLLW